METILSQQLKKQKENNPYKRMHRAVFIVVVACLTVQVLEGAFIIPYILVHFGFPNLSLKEICDEMYIIVYKNEERECNFPYPLFAGPEPWKYKDMRGVIGSPAPPRPHYEGFGFREVIQRREERMARKAAEAAAAGEGAREEVETKAEGAEAGNETRSQDSLGAQLRESDTERIAANNTVGGPAEAMSFTER